MTDWPTTEGLAEDTNAVEVAAWSTTWFNEDVVLDPAKLGSPE